MLLTSTILPFTYNLYLYLTAYYQLTNLNLPMKNALKPLDYEKLLDRGMEMILVKIHSLLLK